LILHGTIWCVALALWLHGSVFFSRLRLGVGLAFGRLALAFDFRRWHEFSRDEACLALLVWFVFCV